MKRLLAAIALLLPVAGFGQDYQHYSMFMYNKLQYNAGYAGSRNVLSVNAAYRNQWSGIDGAPTSMSISVDGPLGHDYMEDFRKVALALVINRESTGPIDNTTVNGYYAYRLKMQNNSVLSLGLQAGVSMYNARYSELNAFDATDEQLLQDVKTAILPNFGFGAFWSSKRYYLGVSVPNLLENYFDKNQKSYLNGRQARQVRSYFVTGGYTIPVNEHIALLPQFIGRYSADGKYDLPFNADINLSAIIFQRFMIGATYRTDKSIAGIVHLQVARKFNIGYSYDYATSDLGRYTRGAHEITVGFDFIRDLNDYADPRFIKNF